MTIFYLFFFKKLNFGLMVWTICVTPELSDIGGSESIIWSPPSSNGLVIGPLLASGGRKNHFFASTVSWWNNGITTFICIFCWTKMFQISWKNWFSWVWKHKIEFIFGKISFEDVTMKRRLFLREINFLKDGKRILKVKLGEFYHHFGDIFQKSNLWITFEKGNFLNFFFKKELLNTNLIGRRFEENWLYPLKILFWNDDMIESYIKGVPEVREHLYECKNDKKCKTPI